MNNKSENNQDTLDHFIEESYEKLNVLREVLLRKDINPFKIVFCGGFSTGKTSLINALMGEECRLPTSILSTTKVITRIKYGPTLQINVKGETHRYRSFEDVEALIRGEDRRAEDVSEVVIELPSPLLKDNVELVDTPGICDDTKGVLDEITKREINHADLCIVVFNPTKFADETERKFMDDLNARLGGNCVSVINCINYINTQKEFDAVQERAEKVLQKYGNDIVGTGTHFFTCSERKYVDLGGFDLWLKQIVDPASYHSYAIKQRSRFSVVYENADKISRAWFDQYRAICDKKKKLIDDREKNIREEKMCLLYSASSLWANVLSENKRILLDMKGYFLDKINGEISSRKGKIYEYTKNTYNALRSVTKEFFKDQVNKLRATYPALSDACNNYDLNYWIAKTIDQYKVPEPISTKHEKTLFGRMVDALDDVVDGTFVYGVSGGKYYYTYNDYTEASKKSFLEEALPKLQREFEGFMEYLYSYLCIKADLITGGLEEELEEVEHEHLKLMQLYREIKELKLCISRNFKGVDHLQQGTWINIPESLIAVWEDAPVTVTVENPSESYSLVYAIEEGSEIVKVRWEEFRGNSINLTIEAKDWGYAKLKIYLEKQPEIFNHIYVIAVPYKEIIARRQYLTGLSEVDNDEKRLKHLMIAAENGHVGALYEVGECYYKGEGCRTNYLKAFEYYSKAAKQDHANAKYSIGFMYYYGMEVEMNKTAAVKWFNEALKAGVEDSNLYYLLGYCYSNGTGTNRDYSNAFKYYKLSAEAGNLNAQNNLGVLYQNGTGVEKSYQNAFEWFMKAANGGLAIAQQNVAIYYEKGYGVPVNLREAVKWYKKAAEQKHVDAIIALKRLNMMAVLKGGADKILDLI